MKRSSSDSFDTLISICPPLATEEKNSMDNNDHIYNKGFQSMLEGMDEEDCLEEPSQNAEKKRRLRVDQVKALEKTFEVENKLEPERKLKLAQELGLQPRQVAIWFQNRRARWKTKQLERDYGLLKADYETLKINVDSLQKDKEILLAELGELKSKFKEENTEREISIKEILISESENRVSGQSNISTTNPTIQDCDNNNNSNGVEVSGFGDLKDGSSDSDSSAILNEDNNNNNSPKTALSSSGVLQQHQFDMLPVSSSVNCFHFSQSRAMSSSSTQKSYQHQQFFKMEDHNFGTEETCDFFCDDQAPSLQWYYCSDQ